jgi:methionyl-tRNA synthetase
MSLQSIRENILKGCGHMSEGMVKGLRFQTQCGNTGFKDAVCLCEVCQAKLSTLDLTEKETISYIQELNHINQTTSYNFLRSVMQEKLDEIREELSQAVKG